MSVNSINYNLTSSVGAYIQRLTAATKKQLEELGIPYNANTTEQEGKKLINNYLLNQKDKLMDDKNNPNLYSNNNTQENDLIKRAKTLAKRLGISFNENSTLEQLLGLIEEKIQEKIKASNNNISLLNELKTFSTELSAIKAQSGGAMGYDSTQSLMKSLEVLSAYNKNFIL